MANADLQTFLEDRLRALDPTIDLDPGSPAQVQFIEPVLTYLGTDPFETDVDSFITDRFSQEFPDVFAGDPGVVRDVFIKPLIMLLEPFKRETETVKRNQSLKDPTVLSDEGADALVANVFDERDAGSFSTGTARAIFPNPTNIQIEITNRFFTADGLSYYPTNPLSITAEEMAFNKTGTQYFLDVPVKAEKEGAEYNIDVDTLSGVDGLFGVVRVTNLSKFENGTAKVDTPAFVAQAREAMNERSLVTRRGATARIGDVFQTELRAIQVIGAKDPEMERDLLVALSPGHQWITGAVTFWKQMALVQARTIEGDEADVPVQGDTLYCYLSKAAFPTLDQTYRLVRLTVEKVYIGPLSISAPYQTMYLVQWSGSFPAGVTITDGDSFEGGFSKKGNVAISSLPGLGATNITAANGEVHVLGHTDFYVRPILQPASTAVISGLSDYRSVVERLTLQTFGLTEKNKVGDPGSPTIDFVSLGVEPGDLLSIETGDDIGVFTIYEVTSSFLWVGANLTNSQTGIRYRIIKHITIDPFEPKIFKFPFASLLANDLQTTIGSNLFKLTTNDMIGFGVTVGDVIRVTSGIIAGDYTITGFDTVLGGQGLLVDRNASASLSALQYQVFTPLEKVERPLVRIKELLLLDSSKQSTGISIPLAQPVGVVPTSNFSSARVRGSSQRLSGFTLPSFKTSAFTTYLSGGPVAAPSGDRRYSLGFDTPEGWYFPVQFADTTYSELDYRANPVGGTGDQLDPSSYFVSVSEETDDVENFPPVDPKPGECLSIRTGPNKGNYLIKEVIKFKHRLAGPTRTVWTYFIKIYGSFPVDVLGQLFDFLNTVGGAAATVELPITGSVTYPDFYQTFYNSLGTKMNAALTALGVASPPSAADLQASLDSLVFSDYDWGDPARGVLRTFFQSPTLFEQRTGDSNPTTYSFVTESGETVKFRADTNRYRKQELIPPRLTADADPLEYPRDLDITRTLTYSAQTSNFTVGKTLTGQSSGASATIIADVDAGVTGTLTLKNIVGAFEAGEIIVDDNGVPGSATAGAGFGTSLIVDFTDIARPPIFSLGVLPGDVLSVHEELFFHGTDNSRQTAIQTIAGTTQITAPTTSGNIFTADMVGNLLYIEQGQDADAYRVVRYIDGKNIVLDKALTESTPTILAQGPADSWGHDGVDNKVESGVFDFTPYIGKFITIYGMSYKFQGSYEITGAAPVGTCIISKPAPDFPGSPIMHSEVDAHWVITDSPASIPAVAESGTELYALRPIRMYESSPKDIVITSRVFDDLSLSQAVIESYPALVPGLKQPFRIYRNDVRRVTPSEMDEKHLSQLVYFDTEVSSFSPYSSANLDSESFLTVDEGTYTSFGYSHSPDDRTLTYSMEESGTLNISPRILPIGSTDSEENFINLLGSAIQVTYEQSDLVRKIQEFADSVQDRVTSANILVRHFLPAYVSYDAEYVGGSAPSVIASDIISYIDNLPVETPLDVSEVQDLISRRGGNLVTPTSAQTLIHDWSRRVWLEFSANQVGGTSTKVPYDGTPRVSFFIPGPDVSGQDPIPEGERINLTRS